VYPDWERLLARLAADATAAKLRAPIVIDELPYLVAASPELPSVLQRWIDHDAKRARLCVAIAGSSQRMMQGLVLSHDAALYGRARVTLDLSPLAPEHLVDAFGRASPVILIEHWAAWGGIPRYWELAASKRGAPIDRLVALALEPLGPLFAEPERLLLEETPPAIEIRPVLDAIGSGAHRLSEIAGRMGRPATSLGGALDRLAGIGLIKRETPYGEPARGGKRSLYKIDDAFLRMWFRVVAPNRAALTAGTSASRRALLLEHWDHLVSEAWEDLCRVSIPNLLHTPLARLGPWRPAQRHWHGNDPEWDIVADAVRGTATLVGDAWFTRKPATEVVLRRECARLESRALPAATRRRDIVRALFVPTTTPRAPRKIGNVHVATFADVSRNKR
jgi:AAA+ ATPase superfamily predicted ATPase